MRFPVRAVSAVFFTERPGPLVEAGTGRAPQNTPRTLGIRFSRHGRFAPGSAGILPARAGCTINFAGGTSRQDACALQGRTAHDACPSPVKWIPQVTSYAITAFEIASFSFSSNDSSSSLKSHLRKFRASRGPKTLV